MKKNINILFCLLFLVKIGYSQSIKRSVISSFGSSSSNGTTYLSETFGQSSSIGLISDGSHLIRQGFEQPVGCVGGTIFSTTNQTICEGEDISIGNSTYTTTGVYTDSLITIFGCDSIITTNLTVLPSTSSTTNITSCDNYSWNGSNYTSSGSYTYVTTNTFGCDSVANLELVINSSNTGVSNIIVCDTYIWEGQTITTSGDYNYTYQNSLGCDSIHTLTVEINNTTTSTTVENACNSYDWNGNTYNSSGTYTYNTINSNGCDSIATLELVISSLEVDDVTTNTSCFGDVDGSAEITVLGGILPYNYSWSSGEISQDLINVPAGNYILTVIDSNDCSITHNITIDEPQDININPYIINATCEVSEDASIDIDPYGGTTPYTFLWSNGQITEDLDNIQIGEYSILVTDFNGCQKIDTLIVDFDGSDDCLLVPNLFTPNGDGIHDTWQMNGLSLYPDVLVQIFNRWGQLIFSSNGYSQNWDGKYKGNDLPIGTYYYVIDLKNDTDPLNGHITIKR